MDEPTHALLELRHAATDRATIVTVPERQLLAIDGVGSPKGADFRLAISTLHDVADRLRALARRSDDPGRVPAMECAWWLHPEPSAKDLPRAFADRAPWHWQLMAEVPSRATEDDVETAIGAAAGAGDGSAVNLRLIHFEEGRSAQILQIGGPDRAADAVATLLAEVERAGLRPRGHLHEIYLNDPLRVSPDRARTIIRLPIEGLAAPG